MNILFYYPSIGLGGQQTSILQIAEQLNLLGHKVSWLYTHDSALRDKADQVCVTKKVRLPKFNNSKYGFGRILNRWLYYNYGANQLVRYCRENSIQLVITSSTPDSIMVNKILRKVRVTHFRFLGGSMFQVEPHWLEKYERLGIDKGIDGYIGWPALQRELDIARVPSSKFIEMNFAVNCDLFFPLAHEAVSSLKHEWGISEDEFVIGWVGRVAMNMQVWNTLKLGAELKRRGVRNFKLLVVGGGDDLEFLKEELIRYDLVNNTIVTGWIPFEKVNEFINMMDCVPLLEEDPHGGSIVREAMACGKVALSVDGASGTQAWFMKTAHSILVKPDDFVNHAADEIVTLMNDEELKIMIGTKAREYAHQHLSFKKQAETILQAAERYV